MKKIILGSIMALVSFEGLTKSYDNYCFQEHIKESIAINKDRKKIYAELTDGRSNKIFNKLISYEYVTLAPALYFDLRVLPYHQNGMDLFCHEFMSLIHNPEFDPNSRKIPTETFRPFDYDFYKKRILNGLKEQNVTEVRKAALEAIIELKKQPSYYCFSRHFFESIYRFAYFIPLREEQADQMDLKSPKKIMMDVIKLHTLGIKDCHDIDIKAQPIQMGGIPILCSEIPDLLQDLDTEELKVLKEGKK